MNKHQNARYRKVDDYAIVELERHHPGRGQSTVRGRLVGWVKTDTGWGKLGSVWGSYTDLEGEFRKIAKTNNRRKAHERFDNLTD